jgi:putative hemolysin
MSGDYPLTWIGLDQDRFDRVCNELGYRDTEINEIEN